MVDLELLHEENNIDILCVCEDWLTEPELQFYSTLSCLNLASFFCRGITFGGVAVYVKRSFDSFILDFGEFCEEIEEPWDHRLEFDRMKYEDFRQLMHYLISLIDSCNFSTCLFQFEVKWCPTLKKIIKSS
ncbi:uncharacterized protein LOC120350426 [Nilaparvata lugens]|uniref:uncharacterized protein LOC120350426 n=1 Tax=Nilaparvata lugens TaxID=108931 RepID=UPI00193CF90B|nr:uncharacterized protein LOC120350426 [Nilaparvata lugens]